MGYIHMGLCSFTHFVNMYAPHTHTHTHATGGGSGSKGEVAYGDLESREVYDVGASWCEQADESKMKHS
ncbi:hypothetical protein EON64_19975 [archaeon]|nr:MAG: hypothetical protein EON64_19975 [archaeon]